MKWKTLDSLPEEGLVWMCQKRPYVPMTWDVERYRAAMNQERWSSIDLARQMTHWMEIPEAPN